MSFEFLITNSPQIDSLRPGSKPVGTERCGASQPCRKSPGGEEAGSFDTALKSARTRSETPGPASSDSREVDAAAKTSGRSRKDRPDSQDPDNPPADGGAVQASQSSAAVDPAMDPPALSTGDEPAAGLALTGLEPAADSVAENTTFPPVSTSSPTCLADRHAAGLTVDAAESTPATPGAPQPTGAAAAPRGEAQPVGEPAETGRETRVFQGSDTAAADLQASNAKTQAPVPGAFAPAADGAVAAATTAAAVKTPAARPQENRQPNRVETEIGGLTAKSWVPSSSASDRGDPPPSARVGGFPSVLSESAFGEDLTQKFGRGAGRDFEAGRGESPASEKGAERALWSTSALKAEIGPYQEGTGGTTAKSTTESEQKVADMLLAPQRAAGTAGEATAATETGEAHHPKDLRAETLNQIAAKAVLRLRNGQSELRIDLKPDTLGQVRLQIMTENHQVTLRIMAESHAAKHLIDSGIAQLKADLQAQGLRVDELEVSVANDSNDFNRHAAFSDRAAQARRMPPAGRRAFQEPVPAAALTPAPENRSTAGVDCFI